MRVALVHEFLTQFGGAEQILKALHEMYPKAPIFVLLKDDKVVKEHFPNAVVRISWLQNLPGMPKYYKFYLGLMPKAIESFDFSGYDLIISDSSAFAKGVITKKPTIHISYIHTPTRYLWGETDYYLKTAVPTLYRPLLSLVIPWLRKWDHNAAQHPDILIANSKEIQSRIKQYYHRDSIVIYPFVQDIHFNTKSKPRQNFYLISGRMVPYKRFDIVIEAFMRSGPHKLVVAGDGYGLAYLKKLSLGVKHIDFRGRVSQTELLDLYDTCKAYIFPALEDFGIVIAEAMAHGTPVICFGKGGALEIVKDRKTGVYFRQQSPISVLRTVEYYERLIRERPFNQAFIRQHALQFTKQRFIMDMEKLVAHLTNSE